LQIYCWVYSRLKRRYLYFYTRKQLLLSAHLSHRNSVRPSVRSSVTRWISQKCCKLGSPNFHCRLPGRL